MSTLTLKELSAPTGEVIKIASGKTLDLNSQGTLILPTVPSSKMPTGAVLQVVSAKTDTNVVFSQTINSGYTAIGLSVSITPISTSSKILVTASIAYDLASGNHASLHFKLFRGSSLLQQYAHIGYRGGSSTAFHEIGDHPVLYHDSPSSTSALTYSFQGTNSAGSTVSGTYNGAANRYNYSTITVMEIQG